MKLFTVVHPIGPDDFGWHPACWRWAIHTNEQFDDLARCLNAGTSATKEDANRDLADVLVLTAALLNVSACDKQVFTANGTLDETDRR